MATAVYFTHFALKFECTLAPLWPIRRRWPNAEPNHGTLCVTGSFEWQIHGVTKISVGITIVLPLFQLQSLTHSRTNMQQQTCAAKEKKNKGLDSIFGRNKIWQILKWAKGTNVYGMKRKKIDDLAVRSDDLDDRYHFHSLAITRTLLQTIQIYFYFYIFFFHIGYSIANSCSISRCERIRLLLRIHMMCVLWRHKMAQPHIH